ncbi:AGC family protein kinase [Thraustotheca clavata]|uniref:AGC family protein kinase n=1 Tax=Thraustotheca clavata TaxID=74557 RepID=A0A1V9ZAC4_9STRA|nr:AGC family protein kinase [Thraustotheca clavata]
MNDRLRRSHSKPESTEYTDVFINGMLCRVPREFVVVSRRTRKAADPRILAVHPKALARTCRTSSFDDYAGNNKAPHSFNKQSKAQNNSSCNGSVPTLQDLRDFSSALASVMCQACHNVNDRCSCAAVEQREMPPLLTAREQAMHGQYLIRESFANGAYGRVHNGEGLASQDSVVVKIIPKYVLQSAEEKQSVIREEVIHRSCTHPNIIRLIDTYQDEHAHFIILERAENGSLDKHFGRQGIPEVECKRLFRQLISALQYLHHHRIVHHDLKPQNILLDGQNNLKVCDFGAARAYNKNEPGLPFSGIYGTPGYIAPELLCGIPYYTTAVDIFSAGLILFEMLFGYAAFYPPSASVTAPVEFPVPRPRQKHQIHASENVKDLILHLLEKDPALRWTAQRALEHPWFK